MAEDESGLDMLQDTADWQELDEEQLYQRYVNAFSWAYSYLESDQVEAAREMLAGTERIEDIAATRFPDKIVSWRANVASFQAEINRRLQELDH